MENPPRWHSVLGGIALDPLVPTHEQQLVEVAFEVDVLELSHLIPVDPVGLFDEFLQRPDQGLLGG